MNIHQVVEFFGWFVLVKWTFQAVWGFIDFFR
jgi:hypothetical protein